MSKVCKNKNWFKASFWMVWLNTNIFYLSHIKYFSEYNNNGLKIQGSKKEGSGSEEEDSGLEQKGSRGTI